MHESHSRMTLMYSSITLIAHWNGQINLDPFAEVYKCQGLSFCNCLFAKYV